MGRFLGRIEVSAIGFGRQTIGTLLTAPAPQPLLAGICLTPMI
jgi:hypothetical protein